MDRQHASKVTTGAVLITLGVILLFNQFELGPSWNWWWRLWPIAMIVIGTPILIFGDKTGHRSNGLWLASTGILLLLHQMHVFSLRYSWPLLIVVFGASLLIGSGSRPPGKRQV